MASDEPVHGTGPSISTRAVAFIGDALAVVAIVVSFPVAILAIGTPIALVVRLLLWLIGSPVDP